jgi:hypothetical protein
MHITAATVVIQRPTTGDTGLCWEGRGCAASGSICSIRENWSDWVNVESFGTVKLRNSFQRFPKRLSRMQGMCGLQW